MRNEKKLVERITITIKVFESGDWGWDVRQRFLKEPKLRHQDFAAMLRQIEQEVATNEQPPARLDAAT